MDPSEVQAATEPTYLDALLLMALDYAESRGLKDAYALVDGLERLIIEPAEWEHACQVLGSRGLIAPGPKYPAMTDAGRALLMNYSVRLSRPVAHQIAEDLKAMPPQFGAVPAPALEQQNAAIAAYRGMFASPLRSQLSAEGE